MCVKFDKDFFKQFGDEAEFNKIAPVSTFVQLFRMASIRYRNLRAVINTKGQYVTFSKLLNDVAKVSSYFKQKNIVGNNIGIYCSNGYEFEVISLGIIASGNVVCLLPITFNEEMIKAYVSMLNIRMIISDNNKIKNFDVLSSEQILRTDPLLNPYYLNSRPDDAAAILLTGGTTGKPKGAILSQANLLAGAINGCYGTKKIFNQTYYCMIPLTHSFGFIRNMLGALYTGSCICYNENKQDIFRDLNTIKPTVLIIVPALAELFLNLIKGTGKDVIGGKVHTIISGGANVPPYLCREYHELGITFCPGYGLTECSNMVAGNPISDKYPDSVGYLFPGQFGKIVDGELYLRGNTLFKGYYNNKLETDNVMADGWFKTGDLARFDENNMLYIVGRKKDIIVLPSGENVSPAYVESKVNTLDLIQDSLVYDSKNNFGNTELVCEVTLRPVVLKKLGLNNETAYQYVWNHIEKINAQMQDYEHINKLIIRDKDFERSPAMKIIRKAH